MISVKHFQEILSDIQVNKNYGLLHVTKNALTNWIQSLRRYNATDTITTENCAPTTSGNSDLLVLVLCDLSKRLQEHRDNIQGEDIRIIKNSIEKTKLVDISPDIATIYTQLYSDHSLFINIPSLTPAKIKNAVKNYYGEKLKTQEIWSLATESVAIASVIKFLIQEHGPEIASIYLAFATDDHYLTSTNYLIPPEMLFNNLFTLHSEHSKYWVQAAKWLERHRNIVKPWNTLSEDKKQLLPQEDILVPALELYDVQVFEELIRKTSIVEKLINHNSPSAIEVDTDWIEDLNPSIST